MINPRLKGVIIPVTPELLDAYELIMKVFKFWCGSVGIKRPTEDDFLEYIRQLNSHLMHYKESK